MNDIERYNFWNQEQDEFVKKERQKEKQRILDMIMRWDSIANKVPINEKKVTEVFHTDIPDYLHH